MCVCPQVEFILVDLLPLHKAETTAVCDILSIYVHGFYAICVSVNRGTIFRMLWHGGILQLWPRHLMERSMEESLIFLVCDCIGLIRLCSAVCHSDIVIRFSSRGTFQALCWLLIGLKCNECVILMTQIQLIVIFMSCECSFFSIGLDGTEVYQGMYVCKRENVWMLGTKVTTYSFFSVPKKAVTSLAASRLDVSLHPFPMPWCGEVKSVFVSQTNVWGKKESKPGGEG